MPQDLAQKIALITGASSGIGLATARAFAAHGARLLVAARRRDRLEAERATLKGAADVHILELDVTDHAAVERAVATLPQEWQGLHNFGDKTAPPPAPSKKSQSKTGN